MVVSRTGLLSLLMVALCFVSGVSAQSDDTKKIDEFFSHLDKNNQFIGSVSVFKNGKPWFSKAYGIYGHKGKKALKSNTDTKYRIGSISKTFTSTMIMQLVEAGKISLDDKLSKYFPESKNADTITLDNMLLHRSGLGNLTVQPGYLSWSKSSKTRKQMMEKINAIPASFKPDEKTEYSNTNYVLLGYIIEDMTGKSYGENLKTRISEPLGLTNTYMGKKAVAAENEALSFSISSSDWKAEPETHMSIPHGAGAIVSTPEDLAKFMLGLVEGKLVSEDSLKLMVGTERMGRGMFKFPFGRKIAIGHNGGIDGFQSNLAHFREDNVTIAVVGNGVVYPFNDALIGALSHTFGVAHELPSFETVEVEADLLKRYEGVYSCKKFPLKITVAVKNDQLTGQATGQGAFPLNGQSETEFVFDQAKISMKFTESKKGKGYDGFNFKQGPNAFKFKKE